MRMASVVMAGRNREVVGKEGEEKKVEERARRTAATMLDWLEFDPRLETRA